MLSSTEPPVLTPPAGTSSSAQAPLQLEFYEPPLEFLRPGEGEPGPSCGATFFWRCVRCGHRLAIAARCLRRVCPNCGGTRWAWRQARVVLARMMAVKRKFLWPFGLRHVTVSFDNAEIPEDEATLRRQRKGVYSTLRAMGFVGGICVFHPWRKRCLECGASFEGGHPHTLGVEWVVSPHWHVIGLGKVDADKRPRGAFVKAIPRGKGRSWTATIKYVLDHAGVADNHHAYTWWGEFSYNKFPEADLSRFSTFRLGQDTERVCPFDGADLVVCFPGYEFREVLVRFPWLDEPPDGPCLCPNCPSEGNEPVEDTANSREDLARIQARQHHAPSHEGGIEGEWFQGE